MYFYLYQIDAIPTNLHRLAWREARTNKSLYIGKYLVWSFVFRFPPFPKNLPAPTFHKIKILYILKISPPLIFPDLITPKPRHSFLSFSSFIRLQLLQDELNAATQQPIISIHHRPCSSLSYHCSSFSNNQTLLRFSFDFNFIFILSYTPNVFVFGTFGRAKDEIY